MGDSPTLPSFPTYASLTQTSAWATTEQPIAGDETSVDLTLPRYTEGSILGVGGMGKVLLARDERIGRDVAVKELRSERTLAPEERARFLREARVQGQLEHPSIVPVYDIDRRPDGTTFFTMRRVMGKTLHAILEELRAGDATAKQRFTQHELLSAFATVCLAVDYAHTRGVIHRDLKPANLMLGDFGEVYVLDWGLARLVNVSQIAEEPEGRLSTPGEIMGTPLYMAPEQMNDPEVGPEADVYSLGAILFELLTLVLLRDPRAPFVPGDARPSVRTPDRAIAPELETICVKATAADPTMRYPSARALQQAVVRYLEGDRELERRRELAAAHARTAKTALARADLEDADGEAERGTAMRELAKALAFNPAPEHVALLGEVMTTPPKIIPPTVREQLREQTERIIHTYAHYSGPAMLAWFLFVPVLFAIGIRSWWDVFYIAFPAAAASATAFYAASRRHIGYGLQIAVMIFMLLGAIAISRVFGPLIMMPTLVASYAIVLQAHPSHWFRQLALLVAALALTVPTVLELLDVIPRSYAFDAGRWIVLPQMIALPQAGTIGLLFAANLSMTVIPCMFIAKMRADLSNVQARQLVQAWHFRRLGDELMKAAA